MRIVQLRKPAPPDVLSQARYSCGFGCIRCGCTIVRYFTARRDDGVSSLNQTPFLVCPGCTDILSAGISDAAFSAIRSRPVALQREFDDSRLPFLPAQRGLDIPDVTLSAGITMYGTGIPIVFGGVPVIVVAPPEVPGGAIRISVMLGDGSGPPARLIEGNEWLAEPGWSFAQGGRRYKIGRGDRAWLELSFHPRTGISIEDLRTCVGGRILTIDDTGVRVDGAAVEFSGTSARLIGVTL